MLALVILMREQTVEGGVSQRLSVREIAALVVLLLGCLISNYGEVAVGISREHPAQAGITRMAVARDLVPPMSVLGYFDGPHSRRNRADVGAMQRFHLAQYELAPAVVQNREDTDLVLADLYDPSIARRFASDQRWIVLRDCGSGILLVKRKR